LVKSTFDEFAARDCTEEGLGVFYGFIEKGNFIKRNTTNSTTLLAVYDNKIVGMLEMRDYTKNGLNINF